MPLLVAGGHTAVEWSFLGEDLSGLHASTTATRFVGQNALWLFFPDSTAVTAQSLSLPHHLFHVKAAAAYARTFPRSESLALQNTAPEETHSRPLHALQPRTDAAGSSA